MSVRYSDCDTCKGRGTLGGCGRDDCDHMHTYMFCPDCNPQPKPGEPSMVELPGESVSGEKA